MLGLFVLPGDLSPGACKAVYRQALSRLDHSLRPAHPPPTIYTDTHGLSQPPVNVIYATPQNERTTRTE